MLRRLITLESSTHAATSSVKIRDAMTGQPIHNCKRLTLHLDADNIFIEGTMTLFKENELGQLSFKEDEFGNVSADSEDIPIAVTEVNLTAHVTDITE